MEIYVHVPFCAKKCDYCDFYSLPNCCKADFDRYITAVEKEIRLAGKSFGNRTVKTVFVGGGTPSLIGGEAVATIMRAIKESFDFAPEEVTVECNPESATAEFFAEIKSAGVNRVSIGIQSLDDENLKAVGRIHNANKALDAVKLAQKYFDNVSVDFIVGLPFDTPQSVAAELEKIADEVQHISCYELILDGEAPLYQKVKSGQIVLPDDDEVASLFESACVTLRQHGFERYEVSNFCKPDKASKHNLGYWTREEYLGFGPSAHSYYVLDSKETRQNNVYDLAKYIEAVENSNESFAAAENFETLDDKGVLEEKIYLGLRTSAGIDKNLVDASKLDKYADFLVENGTKIALNDKGMAVMDSIVTDLLP